VHYVSFQNGESALHAASLFGHLSVVKALVQRGAVTTLCNKSGETPIDLARQMGYDHIVDFLVAHK
uniref:Uncharacterized protein n=1 Tax=Plectus sambesii TaxID=2011161 RepID=A0A914VEP2_9BILA